MNINLIDFKIEFGRTSDGEIVLADEVSPDTCRLWDMAFESIRWWDILRWSGPSLEEAGDILNKQTGFNIINAATVVPMVKFDYKKRLQATQGYWPIPQDEIDISNGVLEQNPGWDASAQFSDWNNM